MFLLTKQSSGVNNGGFMFLYSGNYYSVEQLVNIFKLSTTDITLTIKGA